MKSLKKIGQWGGALICSVFILNILTFCFYHPVQELKRNGGATPGLMYPHMWGLYGMEGFGIQTIDANGYVNPDLPREKNYYCIIGASHTEGFHSRKNERYSDLLNEKFGYIDSIKFYNIAHSDFTYTGIVKRFNGLVMEFPEMKGLVIEISGTQYSPESLRDALNQTGFSYEDTITSLMQSLTFREKCLITIKNYFPLMRLLGSQLATYNEYNRNNVSTENNNELDLEEYRKVLSATMDLIRGKYAGPIVIVYHPMTTLDSDGSLLISNSVTDTVFEEECIKHNIDFINMKDSFEKDFYENDEVAYGFWNTTMMSGHINKRCHELIADKLYDYFSDKGID